MEPVETIAKAIEQYKLDRWGFVIYRCTYKSQEKWTRFIDLVKQETRDYLGVEHVSIYDKIDWTVIEDAEALEGASIIDTSRMFLAWRDGDGKSEKQVGPRYHYFMHVDEESLESVVDDEKAKDRNTGYFCKIVYPSSVMNREEEKAAGEIAEDQDPLDEQFELLDCVKKFGLPSLVTLYGTLFLNLNSWYYIIVHVDYDHVGIAVV
jgi:hypothetical protein